MVMAPLVAPIVIISGEPSRFHYPCYPLKSLSGMSDNATSLDGGTVTVLVCPRFRVRRKIYIEIRYLLGIRRIDARIPTTNPAQARIFRRAVRHNILHFRVRNIGIQG